MSIRVSSNQMVYGYQKQLNDANTRQTTLLEQGDGSKLHRPSDAPVDYSKFIRYDASLNENEQYTNNVDNAISWMKTSDSALVNMTAIQTTFKEKTIAAANDTNNTVDMAAIGKEMMAEIQELISLGNTMQGDRYVFGGQRDLTKPFELSEDKIDRGLAKTLDVNQEAFFSGDLGINTNGSLRQMLTLEGETRDGNVVKYYLNTKNGKFYSEDFVENGYKDIVAQDAKATVKAGQEAGTVSGWGGSTDVGKYFYNTGQIKADGETFHVDVTLNGEPVTLKFKTVRQQLASYTGDNNQISMVKKNGTTEPTADAVNVTGPQIFGCDIFDDPDSGNAYSGTAMLNEMLTVHTKVVSDDHRWLVTDGQTVSDTAHAVTVETETFLGARQQLYTSAKTMLGNQNETITSDITDVGSTDVAKLAVRLMQEQTIYNMSLSLGARILPQSLADYL
ncbi:flagellar hook-associated protein FlgL [Selenomonas ruminantium]|uniref:Flagellar hook-associated protein 3 FlgL n=1 Tax=Selenomonas ruminantium TaxID=971 RepID=A0A1H0RH48_SELRU|nr:flagellar hook-associated protein FlgL [Selenomonas ruminantium]SDP28834.1 flagellar hook-associated protein 3 FlgL [Selenomonas ruminantium]